MTHVGSEDTQTQPVFKQVEFNTIASSFGGLSSRVCSLHKFLSENSAYPEEGSSPACSSELPENDSIAAIARGIAQAHRAYGVSNHASSTCVFFIIQADERNVFDQKHIEYELFLTHGIRVFRVPFDEVLNTTKLGPERALIYSPPAFPDRRYEVTTVYLRAGYSPKEYVSEGAWTARYHLERSAAIKCPSVLTHLAGSKKIQQILATPGSSHLQRFLADETLRQQVEHTFASMYPLDDDSEAGLQGRRLATNPETAKRFVLKPQREGGGNNIYRSAIPDFLHNLPESKWAGYVLMEMIEPPTQQNIILRNGEVQQGGVVCELGIFGTCLWKMSKVQGSNLEAILLNEEAGYLLRTKGDQSEEGGVAAGFGAIDSACLFDC